MKTVKCPDCGAMLGLEEYPFQVAEFRRGQQ